MFDLIVCLSGGVESGHNEGRSKVEAILVVGGDVGNLLGGGKISLNFGFIVRCF